MKRRLIFFLGIFALAFSGRMIAVQIFQTDPINDLLWNDYVAWNLVQGNGFTASLSEPRVPGIHRTPGYPVFLAIIYYFFGHSYYAAYVANALLDAGTAVLIGVTCTYYVSVPLACTTAILYALYPYPAMFCPVLHQDILLTFSVMWILLLLARATRRSDSFWCWLWTGLMCGVATLVKPNFILFLAVPIATLIGIRRSRRLVAGFFSFVLGAFVVIGPWMLRNYLVFGSFPLLAAGGTGTVMKYLVTEVNKGETALLKTMVGDLNSPVGHKPEAFLDGAALIASEKRFAREAMEQLKQDWPGYLWVSVKHVPRLWFSRYAIWQSKFVRLAGQIVSLLVLIPGILGMILLRKHWRMLLPLYLTILLITFSYAPYTVEARYTMPARPVMLMFVAATVFTLMGKKDLLMPREATA